MERPDPEDREGMPAMKRLRKSVSFDETKRQHDTLADALVDASRPASADSEPQPPYPVEAQVESSAEGIEGTGAASESASGPSAMDLDGASTAGTAPHSTADATHVAGAAAPSEAPLGSAGETSEIPAANTGVAVQTNTWAAVGAPNGGAADGTYRSEGGRMSSMSSSSLTPEGGWRAEEAEAMDRSTSRSISGTSSFDMEVCGAPSLAICTFLAPWWGGRGGLCGREPVPIWMFLSELLSLSDCARAVHSLTFSLTPSHSRFLASSHFSGGG